MWLMTEVMQGVWFTLKMQEIDSFLQIISVFKDISKSASILNYGGGGGGDEYAKHR